MRRDRGFASIIAVGLIGLIGATLAALALTFSADVKRSTRLAEEAQLRQLLIAGEAAAQASIAKGGTPSGKIDLPAELSAAGIAVSYERLGEVTAGALQIRITAIGSNGRSLGQTLTFKDAKLQSAELN